MRRRPLGCRRFHGPLRVHVALLWLHGCSVWVSLGPADAGVRVKGVVVPRQTLPLCTAEKDRGHSQQAAGPAGVAQR